jgi:hypothetical protein
MNKLEDLQKRIVKYLMLDNFYETIGLIEDEIEDIINNDVLGVKSDFEMKGNGKVSKIIRKGYVITDDNGTIFFAPTKSFKGERLLIGDRVQFNVKQCNLNKNVCCDFMKCLSFDELKFNMFSCIESLDMIKASSYAWALYNDAEEHTKKAMKLCIHTLRNYIKENKNNHITN